VIVYCWDYLCDMSPRAAAQLDTLGFERVYDYAPSKVDYLARGLPREGEKATDPRPIDAVSDDVVLCGLADRVEEIRGRIESSPYGFALVVSEERVVLGRLRGSALQGADGATAEALMEPGPSSIRANEPIEPLRKRMEERGLQAAVVTTPDGVLLGVARGDDLQALA
jgi:hypothetical protein